MKNEKTIPLPPTSGGTGSLFKRKRGPARANEKGSLLYTLRGRLSIAFILVALSPMIGLAIFYAFGYIRALTDSANNTLAMGAQVVKKEVEVFLSTNWYAIDDEAKLAEFSNLLGQLAEGRRDSQAEQKAAELLDTLYDKQHVLNKYIQGYWLIDRTGRPVLSTLVEDFSGLPPFLGLNNADPYSFNLVLNTGYPYISPVLVAPGGNRANIYFVGRVINNTEETVGLLVAQYDAQALQAIMEANNDLGGPGSFAVLLDENHIRLAQGVAPGLIYQTVTPLDDSDIRRLQSSQRLPAQPGLDISTNLVDFEAGLNQAYSAEPYFTAVVLPDSDEVFSGAVAFLSTRSWVVAYLMPRSVYLAPLNSQHQSTLIFILVVGALTLALAVILTSQLTKPITRLIQVAEKVTAGNLWAQAPETRDEIGGLARAFNAMTSQLRQTLEGLEHRVAERTAELAKASDEMKTRATQLQTVAEVAHAIASLQDPDKMLPEVTRLVSERFAFYHVGIFLLDKNGEYAVLRAANSEGGQRMLARSHSLKVGEIGIVGFVTGKGEPRIALDVGADAVFFNNPDLPYTRSEMAVPLKVGDRIIGALDVQSMEQSAFGQEDIDLLTTLADQIAVAIENTRLYSETRRSLAEMQTLHRRYVQEAWSATVEERRSLGYEYMEGQLLPTPEGAGDEIMEILESYGVIVKHGEEEEHPATDLIAPISVRGEVIGMLNLGSPGPMQSWTEDDINLVRAVADQIGQALENARLLEETQRRAEREHMVSDITAKLRATNDPQAILRTAASELRAALHAQKARFTVQPSIPAGPAEQVEQLDPVKQIEQIEQPEQAKPVDGNGHKPVQISEN